MDSTASLLRRVISYHCGGAKGPEPRRLDSSVLFYTLSSRMRDPTGYIKSVRMGISVYCNSTSTLPPWHRLQLLRPLHAMTGLQPSVNNGASHRPTFVKALFLDVAGTLLSPSESITEVYRRYGAKFELKAKIGLHTWLHQPFLPDNPAPYHTAHQTCQPHPSKMSPGALRTSLLPNSLLWHFAVYPSGI